LDLGTAEPSDIVDVMLFESITGAPLGVKVCAFFIELPHPESIRIVTAEIIVVIILHEYMIHLLSREKV
jgi:hypothetical protein